MDEKKLTFYQELKKELGNLYFEWKVYFLRHSILPLNKNRILLKAIFLFIVFGGVFWVFRKVVYAQDVIAENPAYYYFLNRLFSWIMCTGIAGLVVNSLRRQYLTFKRWFDVLFSIIGLIVLSPLFLIVAFLIRLDSNGAVFFRQRRVGINGKTFMMFKFRTMREDAELQTGPVWTKNDDPRVTRIGKFLRRTQLDKLPELINVFRGDMSVIGPCPERPEFLGIINRRVSNFDRRLEVKPGIIGLAQVRYKYAGSTEEAASKLKYDLLYINKMCWLLDFKIILWTMERFLTGEGKRYGTAMF